MVADVILLILELWCAFQTRPLKNVTRKSNKIISIRQNYFARFNGISFKPEPSSIFDHKSVYALGSYRNSPFVTGSDISGHYRSVGLNTEILDYKAQKWTEVKDYPFACLRLIEILIYSWNYSKWGHLYHDMFSSNSSFQNILLCHDPYSRQCLHYWWLYRYLSIPNVNNCKI